MRAPRESRRPDARAMAPGRFSTRVPAGRPMTSPTPEQLAYLDRLREAQRRRGERSRAERERDPEPELKAEPIPVDPEE